MAKPELGTKRLCSSCSTKFYDLSKSPIVCPKCHAVMELSAVASRARAEPVAPVAPRPAAVVPAVAEDVVPETADAEFVSLEDADAEAQGKKGGDVDAVEGGDEEEIEIGQPIDDDAALIETEESDDDVTDIIGDREDEEET